MGRNVRSLVISVLVAGLITPTVLAQDWEDWEWNSRFHNAANTGNTEAVLGATPHLLWAVPAGGGTSGSDPIVHLANGTQMVIAGHYAYEAWTGEIVCAFPEAGKCNATTRVHLQDGTVVHVLLTVNGSEYFAYDITDALDRPTRLLWYGNASADPGLIGNSNYPPFLNAKDGIFYVGGQGQVAALDALGIYGAEEAGTPKVCWYRNDLPLSGSNKEPTVATIPGANGGKDMVFVGTSGGLVALDASGGATLWYSDYAINRRTPAVDEETGFVFSGGVQPDTKFVVYDGATGTPTLIETLDTLLNGPPTFGETIEKDEAGNIVLDDETQLPVVHSAVFAVTGLADDQTSVYAFDRSTFDLLWHLTIPVHDCFTYATYAGGKLYIPGTQGPVTDGRTMVVDCATGAYEGLINTKGSTNYSQSSRAIVKTYDDENDEIGVMFNWSSAETYPGYYLIQAWASAGEPKGIVSHHLSSSEDPVQLGPQSSVEFPVHFKDGFGVSIPFASVTLTLDGSKSAGYLEQSVVQTDESGQATVVYHSENRTGTFNVIASALGATSLSIPVTVTKSSEPTDPPATGVSVGGVVYLQNTNKPLGGVPVDLFDTDAGDTVPVMSTTSHRKKGTYSFDAVSAGNYKIVADGNTECALDVAVGGEPIANADIYLP